MTARITSPKEYGHRAPLQWRRNVMGRSLILTATILLALVPQSNAQTKRAMTIDDLITTVRVGDPELSPNGKQVVFTRTTTALDTGRRNADIWTVPADGSEAPRELIGGER